MRDSLTILDQTASFSSNVEESDVKALIGVSDFGALNDVACAVIEGDRKRLLETVTGLVDRGTDLRAFTKDMIKFFRDLLVTGLLMKSPPGDSVITLDEIIDVSEEELVTLKETVQKVTEEHLALLLNELIKAEAEVRSSFSPRVALEMALIRASYLSTFKPVSDAIRALRKLSPDESHAIPVVESPPVPSLSDAERHIPPAGPTEPVQVKEPPAISDGDSLLKALISGINDPRISSKLSNARPELKGDTLTLTFGSPDEEMCAKPLMEASDMLSKAASNLRGAPTVIEINIEASKALRKKDLKEKALSEPLVKEALDLFEGRLIDVRPIDEGG